LSRTSDTCLPLFISRSRPVDNPQSTMAMRSPSHQVLLSLMLLVLFRKAVVAQTSESSATRSITTLPPAVPTGDNSDPCAFPDRNSLLDRVESDLQEYNVSLLVATCPNVCPFVFGTGNPDISGIGVGCT
jgi:hypothetical protein